MSLILTPDQREAIDIFTTKYGLKDAFETFCEQYGAEDESAISMSSIMFIFEDKETNPTPLDQKIAHEILDRLAQDNFESEIEEDQTGQKQIASSAHGFSRLLIWSTSPDVTPEQLGKLKTDIEALLQNMVDDLTIYPIKSCMVWQERKNEPVLGIDFRYRDNDQVSTTSIPETAWRERHQLGVRTEDAVLLLGGDCEVFPEYTAHEITFQDAFYEIVRFQD